MVRVYLLKHDQPENLKLGYRMGIKESVNWLVDVMERSKRTEVLKLRADSTNF